MNTIGQRERATQQRVVNLLQHQLGYTYLGNWQYRAKTQAIKQGMRQELLTGRTRLL